ncbi:DNA ligase [Bradyrhizobium sp. AUGA SZCCT0182]|uniref:ATP-dependent DNA ligase n=1 Tax=Bradyrhizobium sp. AUGA SZCCT0182 TaxID=2807667 RepID=UPI002013476E|nr:DNA ligase [Bradyrhizobium sp. AUGA SZCCT0182]
MWFRPSGRRFQLVETARQIRQKHFVLNGEGVVLGVDGISDFNALHSRKHDAGVQFYAFDMLAGDGDDHRKLPLSMRKTNLCGCWRGAPRAFLSRPFEQVDVGTDLFRAACGMGLEGLVSKHRERAYRAGRSPHWIKVKNRRHQATSREF